MKKRTKKIVGAVLAVGCLLGLMIGIHEIQSVRAYQREVDSITFSDIEISQIPDGVYLGECSVKFISARVEVTVYDGEILSIHLLEHRNERGSAAEVVLAQMVAEQRVDVDAVAGATNSSKVLKKAAENALLSAGGA